MLEQLRRGRISLAPLSLRWLQLNRAEGTIRFDALVEAKWGGQTARFAVEIKALWTPKAFQDGINLLKTSSLPKGILPMLFLPFLSEWQLKELERERISGIDLCGNGVVIVPGRFAVLRGGNKNLFSSSAPIKNIYRKNSSMVGRIFLASPLYKTVQELHAEINRRNPLVSRGNKQPMSLATVSKALKTMADDLIITRANNIRLLQADKLLEKLDENYVPPNITARVSLKLPEGSDPVLELVKQSSSLSMPVIATGLSSVAQYAVMQREGALSVYCPSLERLLEQMPGNRTNRFPDLEIIETDEERVYFYAREKDNFLWASPVQAYLELRAGDQRDRETAEQLKSFLLKNLERGQE